MRQALIAQFQQQVSSTDEVGRKVVMRVLGNPEPDWEQPILDFKSNIHLKAMAAMRSDIVNPVVWERVKSDETKTVLQSFRQT